MNFPHLAFIISIFGSVSNQGCASRSYPASTPDNSALSVAASPGPVQEPQELGHTDHPAGESSEHAHEHQGPETDSVKVIYQCPMHPEVVSDKPGECPKCGMTLEKKESK